MSASRFDDSTFQATPKTSEIRPLLNKLGSEDGMERQRARRALVSMGELAVHPLLAALRSKNKNARWEAAKAFVHLADPAAAHALVEALEDESRDVRWLAAEALVALGAGGVKPLLEALIHRPSSYALRRGAHHVLQALRDRDDCKAFLSVLRALEPSSPEETVPVAAFDALNSM